MSPRIAFVCHDYSIDRRIIKHARQFLERGWEVRVIALQAAESVMKRDPLLLPIQVERIREDIPASIKPRDGERLAELIQQLPPVKWTELVHGFGPITASILKQELDVIVANDLSTLPVAALGALMHRSYLVYDSHELYPEQWVFPSLVKKRYRAAEKLFVHLADIVFAVSDSIANEMMRATGAPVIYTLDNSLGSDVDNSTDSRVQSLRERCGIPPTKKVLLFQGGLVRGSRNIETLVEAMRLVSRKDVSLVLMGPPDGSADIQELLERLQTDPSFRESVHWVAAVPQEELISVTKTADAGIIPYPPIDLNTRLCTPNKLFEYIESELPILSIDLPELNRIVSGQGVGVTLPMNSAGDIAKAIDVFFGLDLGIFKEPLRNMKAQLKGLSVPHSEQSFCGRTLARIAEGKPYSHAPEVFLAFCHALRSNKRLVLETLERVPDVPTK